VIYWGEVLHAFRNDSTYSVEVYLQYILTSELYRDEWWTQVPTVLIQGKALSLAAKDFLT